MLMHRADLSRRHLRLVTLLALAGAWGELVRDSVGGLYR